MSDFPSHSCSIWIGAKGELRLGLPASSGHQQSHSIVLRADGSGMAQLIQILSARLQEETSALKIGCKAVPTQALADALLRGKGRLVEHEEKKAERLRREALSPEELLKEALADGDLVEELLNGRK